MAEDIKDSSAKDCGGLSTIGPGIGDLISGVPAPIRKNAAKAFGRLCSAAVEYPLALIENAIAERRAESRARVALIDASANQIAEQMRIDPEYARVAAAKYAEKIVRERINVDQVAEMAAADLRSDPQVSASDLAAEEPSISDDWLNAFESEAAHMSSEQMQRLFGKILAGEIRRPASFSIKTVKLMAQLDNQAANLFRLLCSLSISARVPNTNEILDARVVSMGSAAANSLAAYGLSFDALNILHEYGLIISDYNSYSDYRGSVAHNNRVTLPWTYQNVKWAFVQKVGAPEPTALKVHGVAFSRSGRELLPIVDVVPDEAYTAALRDFFDKQGMTPTKVAI
ncbi:DUF2806 domain-containing protein [Bordetella genomosp. 5]|uniref:DUF2806 domain-containing protein n=1 Tax=Bordetella genomosp. 5 TaxID=1395608 RepID=A0A261TBF4_9BORD|nr:DUF2806 domain-containing protein [Bordetella genomosp. 5]OZI46968.1 hypothetical protein CAL25_20125 [Bordetella genomosp. 5]